MSYIEGTRALYKAMTRISRENEILLTFTTGYTEGYLDVNVWNVIMW